jgi:hypothetical protein
MGESGPEPRERLGLSWPGGPPVQGRKCHRHPSVGEEERRGRSDYGATDGPRQVVLRDNSTGVRTAGLHLHQLTFQSGKDSGALG